MTGRQLAGEYMHDTIIDMLRKERMSRSAGRSQ
jgi:hypothetical protein